MARFLFCAIAVLVNIPPVLGQHTKPRLLLTVPKHGKLINVDLDGVPHGEPLNVPEGAMEPTWSPDGKKIAFARLVDDTNADVFVTDMKSGDTVNLTDHKAGDRLPAWSPDGNRIAFMSDRTGNNEVFIMNVDGTGLTNLTEDASIDADPAWSPDGARMAFISKRGGRRNCPVFLMNSDGSQPTELIVDEVFAWVYPDWSPDGKRLALGGLQNGTIQLMLFDFESKTHSFITQTIGGRINSFARWSPDGRYIAYVQIPARGYPKYGIGASLYVYDVKEKTTRTLSVGDLPFWGPRPCWVPLASEQ